MKKTVLLLLLLAVAFSSSATLLSCKGSNTRVESLPSDTLACYKLYPTTNMWTFLKLDTRNGRIWQVQWSLEDEKRFECPLSTIVLVENKEKGGCGRFELYPTDNIFNFVMLDKKTGKTYQVQWSLEKDKRGIVPINTVE